MNLITFINLINVFPYSPINRVLTTTADGSHTVSLPESGLTYHSHHGAVQESLHVFIRAGLEPALERFPAGVLRIFEMGFGTGLNAWLTALEAEARARPVHYIAVEQAPLNAEEAPALNYPERLGRDPDFFHRLHAVEWNSPVQVSPCFVLEKLAGSLLEVALPAAPLHLIYFDAFAPDAQPELWTEAVFSRLRSRMAPGGLLTTYCSKGTVRRALQTAGFTVEKIPGPPGKREMVRAFAG